VPAHTGWFLPWRLGARHGLGDSAARCGGGHRTTGRRVEIRECGTDFAFASGRRGVFASEKQQSLMKSCWSQIACASRRDQIELAQKHAAHNRQHLA